MVRYQLTLVALLAAGCGGSDKSEPPPQKPEPPAEHSDALPENAAEGEASEETEEPDVIDPDAFASLPPDLTTGIADCDRMVALYLGCDKLPPQTRDQFKQAVRTWRQSMAQGGKDVRVQLETACKQALQSIQPALKSLGCGTGASTP